VPVLVLVKLHACPGLSCILLLLLSHRVCILELFPWNALYFTRGNERVFALFDSDFGIHELSQEIQNQVVYFFLLSNLPLRDDFDDTIEFSPVVLNRLVAVILAADV